jgi:SAM-dependent methyltransferase
MLASAVRSLFRRSLHPFEAASAERVSGAGDFVEPNAEAAAGLVPNGGVPKGSVPNGGVASGGAAVRTAWSPARLALVHRLWGAGFIFPGGEIETLRMARPLGISAASSLLIIGVGTGGPAIAVTRNLGVWVTGMDTDPDLLVAAKGLVKRAQLTKKISITGWDPDNPNFVEKGHHHCLALEPFRSARAEPILHALARGLKPGGQIVITELAAPRPLDPADHTVRRWAELEHRDPANLLAPVAVTRMLGRVGLDVRIAEDMSQPHLEHALLGWRVMLRDLGRKPSRQEAVPMVAEAELWLLRRRLIRDGRLRMMRWHAISRVPAV